MNYFRGITLGLSIFVYTSANAEINTKKAVYEISEKDGFKVSAVGLKNIDVMIKPLVKTRPIVLPATSLVYLKEQIGVYRLRGDWFKLVFVEVERKNESDAQVKSRELNEGD